MSHETLYQLVYYAPHDSELIRTVRTFTSREFLDEHIRIVKKRLWPIEVVREYRLVKEEML